MPRILLLADINSAHIQKWGTSLSAKGFTVGIFSLNRCETDWFRRNSNIEYLSDGFGSRVANLNESSKLSYIKALPRLKKAIKAFKPDIVHAHYATSYGMLGSLSLFHPYILSVWGSDVYDFPQKSFLHKFLLKRNLKAADTILSTSNAMATEIALYTNKSIEVTPFGVDTNVFKPGRVRTVFNENDIVIGTIKSLETKYGIEYLILAFHVLCQKHPEMPLKLMIVGHGSKEKELIELCNSLGISGKVKFPGFIPHNKVHDYYNMLDIYIALSIDNSESFGVAVVEAQASGLPVVVSNVSGFSEVVENGVTGIIVPVKNEKVAANAIEKIMLDKELAARMSASGRERVKVQYDWSQNLEKMIHIYNRQLNK